MKEGVVEYYMTLPLRNSGLVGAYIISGGLGGIVYSGILLIIALIILPSQGIPNALVILPSIFVLSTGFAGLAAFFASISRRGEIYWAYAQALQVFMVIVSTVFYPASTIKAYLPGPVATIAQCNPLSLAAALLRNSVFTNNPLDAGVLGTLLLASLLLAAWEQWLTGSFSEQSGSGANPRTLLAPVSQSRVPRILAMIICSYVGTDESN